MSIRHRRVHGQKIERYQPKAKVNRVIDASCRFDPLWKMSCISFAGAPYLSGGGRPRVFNRNLPSTLLHPLAHLLVVLLEPLAHSPLGGLGLLDTPGKAARLAAREGLAGEVVDASAEAPVHHLGEGLQGKRGISLSMM